MEELEHGNPSFRPTSVPGGVNKGDSLVTTGFRLLTEMDNTHQKIKVLQLSSSKKSD